MKAAAGSRLAIGAPASVSAKSNFSFTVTAFDAFGNIVTGYLGTLSFTSSDSSVTLPARYTFNTGNAGAHVFSATLKTRRNRTLTATDGNGVKLSVTISMK